MEFDIRDDVISASKLIGEFIRKTPLEFSPVLSELCDCKVYLKLENWQVTGSFKARGALNKILRIDNSLYKKEVVTASTGNHAAAVAYALEKVNLSGRIFLPENVSAVKAEKLRKLRGITLEFIGNDSVVTEKKAKEYAELHGLIYVSPYNDIEIINGQGTIGYEISKQLKKPDAVFVPVGGGGLISGVAGYLKHTGYSTEIIGCQPEKSSVMYESVKQGKILDLPSYETISDGTAGGVEENSLTFDFCRKLIDSWIIVREDEIINALKIMLWEHNLVVEGSAGLALASLLHEKSNYRGKSVVLILCGSKFNEALLKRLIC